MLPRVNVREVHYFNSACEITNIVGYVHGNLVCPVDLTILTDPVLLSLCTQLQDLGVIGPITKTTGGGDGDSLLPDVLGGL